MAPTAAPTLEAEPIRTLSIKHHRLTAVMTAGVVAAAVVLAVALPAHVARAASDTPPISVPAGLLMTMDGHTVWSHNATQVRHVASCIKMLNALVVRKDANLDDAVVVTKKSEIANGGVRLQAGQRLTVRQLLNIMLVHSANDAAMALAVHVGGSESHFVAMMNAEARALGLKHTHAVDPDGLSGREVSNADDLATLGQRVMADPVLRQIVGQSSVQVPRPNGGSAVYPSSDLLMGHYRGLEGIKTGFTSGAGFCYVGAAKRGNVELLGVVLGTPSEKARFASMSALFDWGFANLHVRQVVSAGETHTAEIDGRTLKLYASRPASALVFAQGGRLRRAVMTGAAGAARDGRMATLVVSQDGYPLARVGLFARPPVRAGTLLWVLLGLLIAGAAAGAWLLVRSRSARRGRRLERAKRERPASAPVRGDSVGR